MCGIFCHFYPACEHRNQCEAYLDLIKRRGPDGFSKVSIDCGGRCGTLAGSTLWTQGPSVVIQPLQSSNSFFLWNGDMYSSKGTADKKNDGEEVMEWIKRCGVREALSEVNGPYAFVFLDKSSDELWFGRDPLGRRSLIFLLISDSEFIISSLAPPYSLPEGASVFQLPHSGIFKLTTSASLPSLTFYPWLQLEEGATGVLRGLPWELTLGERLHHKTLGDAFSQEFSTQLSFSDSQLKDINGVESEELEGVVERLGDLLSESVRVRATSQPGQCRRCLDAGLQRCPHPKTAVLFSGGLDSAILACLLHRHVPPEEPIDLCNVAFPRSPTNDPASAPDRITGLKSLEELKTLHPNRQWNFIQIDVKREELNEKRAKHIWKLINPLKSVLDDSLGCALWFAASGQGNLPSGQPYHSSARVLLVGIGADEVFGGYSSHRKSYVAEGWAGLAREMALTVRRIGERNLSRDDRVLADLGIQPRLPFLDEHFLSFALSLPPWQRCKPELGVGRGDKLALRLVARQLGLKGASTLPKKALQFGSRIADPKEVGHAPSSALLSAHNSAAVLPS